jgi:SAM-dependent methyltransferase
LVEQIKKILFPNYVAQKKVIQLKDLLTKITETPVVLIVGGGSMGNGTATFYEDPSIHLISFDIYQTSLTQFIADAHRIPLADRTVDAVWIQNVLEHVLDPWQVVAEIHRILKQDGLVYAETPFLQHVHEGAYDFTRFTESGHRWLFKNFERIDSGVVVGPGSQLLWTLEHIVRDIFRSVYIGKVVRISMFWLQYLDRFIPHRYAIDDASAVFFLGKKSERELAPKEMVAYYQGADKNKKK